MSIKSSMFGNYDKGYGSANANTEGDSAGWRPDNGDHVVLVTGISMKEGAKFKQKDGQEFAANAITFHYTMVEDPGQETPRSFIGKTFTLPVDPKQVTIDGNQKQCEIELARLKGHLTTLLGRQSTNMGADLAAVEESLSKEAVGVTLRAVWEENKKSPNSRPFFKEFLVGKV